MAPGDAGQVVGRGLAFDGGIGGDDHFPYLSAIQICLQQLHAQLARAAAIDGAEPAVEHEIIAAIAGRLLDRAQVDRAFHHAQLLAVAATAAAHRAPLVLGIIAAAPAMADPCHGFSQCFGQTQAAVAVSFQQLKSHALGRFRPDTRKHSQIVDQAFKQR